MSRGRSLAFVSVCAIGIALIAGWLLTKGAHGLTSAEAVRALGTGLGLGDGAPSQHVAIVYDLRLPRLLVAVFAGASLAVAGVVMQAVFRNPLASPDVMGTQAGSALGAVIAIALGLASASILAVPLFAFAGAAAVSALVYAAASSPGGTSVTGILLAGMALNSLVGAATAFFVSAFWGEYDRSQEILHWLMGGLENAGVSSAAVVACGFAAFGAMVVPFARDMDLLTLSEDTATSLGVDVPRVRTVLLGIACGVTGTAVSCTGGIAFVGLVVPHIARLAVGPGHRALLPSAAAAGALVLVVADGVVQAVGRGIELRIGVVTAMLGAPFFLYLLARHRRGYAL